MKVELVNIKTEDSFFLDGIYASANSTPNSSSIDAFLLVHGTYGNFYNPGLLDITEKLIESGFAVASFNTRAHDVISRSKRSDSFEISGTALEYLDDSIQDLDACVKWLTEIGHERIAILGVSMGAVKVIYYQSNKQNPSVKAIIAVSPVRLSKSFYLGSEASEPYKAYHKQASLMVQLGKPEGLINIEDEIVPGQGIFGAAAYLDKYGSEKYNIVNYAQNISDPLLIMSGSLETHPRLIDCAKDAYNSLTEGNKGKLVVIEGGDHSLRNIGPRLPKIIIEWIDSI
tara:strand:+ start:1316 stop:2173 length:858 start_codon:yes stop_codon:yes gene_type:complete